MENNYVEMTREHQQELQQRLDFLINVKREEIKKAIAEAREQGDLSENADYSAAREDQSNNEHEIEEIQKQLKFARIVDKIFIKVLYVDLKKEYEFEICGNESKPFEHKISSDSPLAVACKNHHKGETFKFVTDAGKEMTVKLLEKK